MAVEHQVLATTACDKIFNCDPHHDVIALTAVLNNVQQQQVPHHTYSTSPKKQPWFGYRCRFAAEIKHMAWTGYKQRPTSSNKPGKD